jgi:hypothetical protein
MRKFALGLFLLLGAFARIATSQQSVILSGSIPYSGTANYNTTITINGLPSGCVASIAGAVITITGCPASLPVGVSITCTPTSVAPGATVTCSAQVTNAANLAVTWSSSSGTISSAGVLTAPTAAGTVTVTAHSVQDSSKSGSAAITVVSPATPIKVESESVAVSSGPINVQATSDTGGGSKLVSSQVGQTYDYHVTVPAAGVYTISARLCNFPTGAGTSTIHFEYPIGTDISGPLSILNGTQWTTVGAASGKSVTLPAGAQTIRMVIDALATGGSPGGVQSNWFSFTPAGGAPSSIKLTWDPSTSAAVVGYNIYRGTVSGGPYAKLNAAAIAASPFIDTGIAGGMTFFYVATALGDPAIYASPSESLYSNEAVVSLP